MVSCQKYGIHKRSGDPRALDILRLMTGYPSLRVAYIDEVEEPSKDQKKVNQKVYYSALLKAAMTKSNSSEPGKNLDQFQCSVTIIDILLRGCRHNGSWLMCDL